MGKSASVLPGFTAVFIPTSVGLKTYTAGDTVVLTDAEYAALPASVTRVLGSASTVAEPVRQSTDPRAITPVKNTAASGTVTAVPGFNTFTAVGALTIALGGFVSGVYSQAIVEVIQDATGSRAITLPTTGVKWLTATPTPTLTASKRDVFKFYSYDGGTTVIGETVGQNA